MRHEYLTLEHLLLGLLRDPRCVEVIKACAGKVDRIREKVLRYLEETVERLPEGVEAEPQQTIGVERVLQRAAFHALSSEQKVMDSADVLVALCREDSSRALFLLKEEKIGRLDVLNFISHGIRKENADDDGSQSEGTSGAPGVDNEDEPEGPAKNPLEAYTTNLNQQAADGNIDPLIGRTLELERTIQV